MERVMSRAVVYHLAAGAGVAVQREDFSAWIQCYPPGEPEGLEIFIDPSLFPALREAMDRAERKG